MNLRRKDGRSQTNVRDVEEVKSVTWESGEARTSCPGPSEDVATPGKGTERRWDCWVGPADIVKCLERLQQVPANPADSRGQTGWFPAMMAVVWQSLPVPVLAEGGQSRCSELWELTALYH